MNWITNYRTVRAHQKDTYFESSYRSQLQDVLHIFKGQRFINTHPEEITVAAKSLYLILTTLIGARTLGEEYVDLIYVNRTGKRFPQLLPKLGFILSYALLPYLFTRLVRKYKPKDGDESAKPKEGVKYWLAQFFSSYPKVLDTLMNLHIAIFYFKGEFYTISKRIFGLRYAFGHNKDPKKLKLARGDYSLLGGIILLQFFVKSLIKFKSYIDDKNKVDQSENEENEKNMNAIFKISQLEKFRDNVTTNDKLYRQINVDLSNPDHLPYLPENSRACMLCLSPMTNPSAASCGHLFCWECIVDWVREHPECPLCRQQCLEQNLLPLK